MEGLAKESGHQPQCLFYKMGTSFDFSPDNGAVNQWLSAFLERTAARL